MRSAGIDIGSRTVKLVVVEDDAVLAASVLPTTHDPIAVCRELVAGRGFDVLTATGYGRHLFRRHFECQVVSEIRAAAAGARRLAPDCRAILDIGGQDTKAIALNEHGAVRKFEMNDRCAAGTGRFLEVMATALAFTMEEFAENALRAPASEKLSSMCTVFAESEVVSLVARGAARANLALGIHRAVAVRAAALLARISSGGEVLFCGGVARNPAARREIERELGRPVSVPADPQIVAALGCAALAVQAATTESGPTR